MSDVMDEAQANDMRNAVAAVVEQIKPVIQMDGGEVDFVSADPETGVVEVALSGACVGCSMSSMTLKAGIERIIKDRVPGVTEVIAKGVEAEAY